MSKFKFFESAIIGLLIGVVVSYYILFISSTGRFVGDILYSVSLGHIFEMLPLEYKDSIVYNFIFYVVVYMLYVIILNTFFSINKKIKFSLMSLILLLVIGVGFQQKKAFETPIKNQEVAIVEPSLLATSQKMKKYFGEEAHGYLNDDMQEDVAFLVKRNEGDQRGDMYYLSASLKNDDGYIGTNLLYINENIEIKSISIIEKKIVVAYQDFSEKDDSLQEKTYTAHVVDNVLEEVVLSDQQKRVEN
jgi:hypothetical protein